jgi:hypothetical protein
VQPAISQGKFWDLRGELDFDLHEQVGIIYKSQCYLLDRPISTDSLLADTLPRY